METYLAVAVAILAITFTYLFCIRPMRQGSCRMDATGAASREELRRELQRTRTELDLLRAREAPRTP